MLDRPAMQHNLREIELDNGIKGLLVDIPDAKAIGFNLSFRAGEFSCPPNKKQVAHFLEHVICTANEKYTEKEFIAEISKNGAYTNASTSANDITYTAFCAEFEWRRILELFLLAITEPLFLDECFAREGEIIRQELTNSLTNYGGRLGAAMDTHVNNVDCTIEAGLKSLEKITIDDLQRFYQETHYASNLRFVMAGKIGDKIGQIRQIMADIGLPERREGRRPLFKSPLQPAKETIVLDNQEVDKLYFDFYVVRPKRSFSFAERVRLYLLEDLLFGGGGLGGLNARVTGPAREKGLIYSIGGGMMNFHSHLAFYCAGRVDTDKALPLFELVKQEIAKLRKGRLTDKEIEALKEKYVGEAALREPTTRGLLNYYSHHYLPEGQIVPHGSDLELLPSISKAQLMATLESVFAPGRFYFGLLGASASEQKGALYSSWQALI